MARAAEAPLAVDTVYRRLAEYLARVRLEGVAVGVEQQSRLFLLLSRLENAGAMPATAGAFARLIVPVLAGTPTQQAMCYDQFLATYSETGIELDESGGLSADGKGEEQKTWLRRAVSTSITRAAAAMVISLTIALVVFAWQAIDRRPVENPVSVTNASAVSADPNKLLLEWIRKLQIKELELPKQRPWNRSLRWFYTEFGWQKSMVAALPWLVYAAAFAGLVYLTLAHLRRESLRQNLRTLPLSFHSGRPRFGDRGLLTDLQPLRSLARDEIREIDPEAMAVATAEQGGLLTPRWRTRPVPADFIVLIDRRGPRDHLASYGEAIVETMRSAGLFVEQFDFDRSPWTCLRRRSGEIETLRSVVGGFPGAIFLFLVSESELLDAGSGAPKAWIGEFGNVERFFLVVPEDPSGVSSLGRALPKGLMVAHASPAGLRAIAARLIAQVVPSTTCDAASALIRLVARINERADRWMQAASPPALEVDGLVAELQRAAGDEAYRWIAATAVYPELSWPMTLYLRDRAGRRGGHPALLGPDLLAVAQLPWFRRGWMPDWMRTRLLRRLSAPERRNVRSLLLEAMGITTATRPASPAMQISARNQVGVPPSERIRSDRILVDYLLPSLASANHLFALPEEWAKRIARRPLRRLAIAACCGAIFAAIASFGAVALLPIDECDLYGTSPFQNDAIGPVLSPFRMFRGGYVEKVIAACETSAAREPDNVRFRFQYVRALSGRVNIQPSEIETVRANLSELVKINYIAAINAMGHSYFEGIFPHNNEKALEYFMKAYNLGSMEAGRNLAVVYRSKYREFKNSYFKNESRRLLEEYIDRGGTIVTNYTLALSSGEYGSPDLPKYLEILKLGVDRHDGDAAAEMGALYATGEICADCLPNYKEANKYYFKAIDWSSNPSAATELASDYFYGRGTDIDISQAFYWAAFGARLGNTDAVDLLYQIVATSDETKLVELGLEPRQIVGEVKGSAVGGNEYSQDYLGRILEGQGKVEEALVWYRKASDRGLQEATEAVKRLSSE
ncbi:hypothetical protein GFM02_15330 [Rhizobium leguminosarum bv. viciae]|uniref:tetratricopeptide repeat protein n=1 Tax=Rhizobium leguminosarum TaxID=384 RepID=UPI0014412267|nr:tetratricopeptide repeat protein [Rhizobium leguminosarum]NKK99607.1 hypothetical protein [Rhizobium leguminosarum bv. viciae]